MLRELIKNRIEELTKQHIEYTELANQQHTELSKFPTMSDIYSHYASITWDIITELQKILDQEDALIAQAARNTEYVIAPANQKLRSAQYDIQGLRFEPPQSTPGTIPINVHNLQMRGLTPDHLQTEIITDQTAGNTEHSVPEIKYVCERVLNDQDVVIGSIFLPTLRYPIAGSDKDWVEGNHSPKPNIHDAVRNYLESTDSPGGHAGC